MERCPFQSIRFCFKVYRFKSENRHSIDVIARQTGFADRYRTRRAFLRAPLDSRHR
jgi:hypothetical protein